MTAQAIAIVVVWITVIFLLLRSRKENQTNTRDKWIIRLQFIFFAIAVSLWGESGEYQIDRYLNHYPVALFIKTLCLMTTTFLYYEMLKSIRQHQTSIRLLDDLELWIPIAAIFTFAGHVLFQPIDRSSLRYLVIGFRDAIIVMYVVAYFIPGSWWIFQQESVPLMKVKALCMCGALTCFCITAIGSISAAVLTVLDLEGAEYVSRVLYPFIFIAIILFVIQSTPHHWYAWLFQIGRWWDYQRLKRLESFIASHTRMPHTPKLSWFELRKSSQLELAIYRSLIMILDYYPFLENQTETQAIYHELSHQTQIAKDYSQLVRQIVKIQP